MPQYAIMSELHANWEAFVAVYKGVLEYPKIREICILGDIVGYGPNPNELIAGLQEIEGKGFTLHLNMGGHDAAAIGSYDFVDLSDPVDMERVKLSTGLETRDQIGHAFRHKELGRFIPVKAEAKAAIEWTKEQLTPESLEFLRTRLEEKIELRPGIVCVHGSVCDPVFEYVHDRHFAVKCYESREMDNVRLCFVGHTHQPMVWRARIEDRIGIAESKVLLSAPVASMPTEVDLDFTTYSYIINVGAVGQPRDGDPRATFVVYDSDNNTAKYIRVPYDVQRTKAKIVKRGLPKILATRLDQST